MFVHVIFPYVVSARCTAEWEDLISLFSLLSQGSDADKSDDNLVVDEVSRGGCWPLLAFLHRFHLHKSYKHKQQEHLSNDNGNNNGLIHLCLPFIRESHRGVLVKKPSQLPSTLLNDCRNSEDAAN